MLRTLLAVTVCLLSAAVPVSAAPPPVAAPTPLTTMDGTWPGDIDPTGRLHGVIRNAKTGDPINGACLDVSEYRGGFPPILATACTGPSGAYEMTLPTTRTFRVGVRAAGYRSRWLPNKVNWTEAAVRLTQGGKQLDGALGEDVGILSGTVTRQDGTPDPFAAVSIYRFGAVNPLAVVRADIAGRFSHGDLPTGSYQVAFDIAGYPAQWYPAVASKSQAAFVTIAADQTSTISEQAIALATPPTRIRKPASISGQVTSGGTPVPNALVKVGAYTAETDAEGRYSIADLPAVSYYVSVTQPGLPEWWIGGMLVPRTTNLTEGTNAVVDLTIPAKYGTIRGVLKDYDGTSLPAENSVNLYPQGSDVHLGATTARFDGSFEFRGVPEGTYTLRFFARGKHQTREVTVANGQTLELVETLLAPAYIAVKIVDVGTGAPVVGKYLVANTATSQLGNATTGADGTALIGPIWDFTAQRVTIYATPSATHFQTEGGMDALPGVVNQITLTAEPGATIRMPVVRKDGGSYGDLLCIYARALPFGEEQPGEKHVCGWPDASQTVLLGPLKPGSYRLLVMPAKPLGAQWLGPNGGTGIPEEALVFEVATSKITSTPTVRLDPGHTLLARVDDGQNPLPHSCAYIIPNTYFLSGCDNGLGYIGVENLGPYKWPVLFREASTWNYAATWYGGDGGRMFATPVQLPRPTEIKMTLKRAGRLSISNPPLSGPGGFILRAFDAYTGDYVSGSWNHLDQLDNGRIIIRLETATESCWLTRKIGLFRFSAPYFGTVAGKDVVLSGTSCTQQEPLLLKPVKPGRQLPSTQARQGKLIGHSN